MTTKEQHNLPLRVNNRDLSQNGLSPIVREGIRCASNHRVFVKRSQDRTLLMSLFEHITVAKPAASNFMTKLGKLYCEGIVNMCDPKRQKDEWLQAGTRGKKLRLWTLVRL